MDLLSILPTIDWNHNLLQGFIGALIGSAISVVGVWYITKRQYLEEKKVELARQRLEKLYGPLMLFIKASKKIEQNEESFFLSEEQTKKLDSILEQGYFLAEPDLIEDLVELYGYAFFSPKEDKDFSKKIIKKITEKYESAKRVAKIVN